MLLYTALRLAQYHVPPPNNHLGTLALYRGARLSMRCEESPGVTLSENFTPVFLKGLLLAPVPQLSHK